MIIRNVDASWLSVPIPHERQHVSDFGRITSFDMALVRIEVASGLVGWGESKAAVGSTGSCAALVSCISEELGPQLVGQDARQITRLWEEMYSGPRGHYALSRGRTFPALGRRGLNVAAMSGVDMALWDLLGKSLGAPVVDLWGGPCRADMPLYASGGWADSAGIGAELNGYVSRGFSTVKMRVGVMDGNVDASVARVEAARSALGPDIALMVDAHGTFSASEAKRFAAGVEPFGVRWFEEPVSADDRRGAAAVRSSTSIAIAAGESEFTRFDFRDLIELDAVDIL
jgi:L-alanine-DL-glutamate epimerase-like enolase superfamily enzyme